MYTVALLVALQTGSAVPNCHHRHVSRECNWGWPCQNYSTDSPLLSDGRCFSPAAGQTPAGYYGPVPNGIGHPKKEAPGSEKPNGVGHPAEGSKPEKPNGVGHQKGDTVR